MTSRVQKTKIDARTRRILDRRFCSGSGVPKVVVYRVLFVFKEFVGDL